jgi:hypothetical protein
MRENTPDHQQNPADLRQERKQDDQPQHHEVVGRRPEHAP